tara:strand:+ start:1473 stop:1733 length:261 start_codon:yes stop_codon:yes gene_type:complete
MPTKWNPIRHQRGPFQLQAVRPKTPTKSRPSAYSCDLLTGMVSQDEVEEEAAMLLGDPRDTIVAVYVWTVRRPRCIMVYRRKEHDG